MKPIKEFQIIYYVVYPFHLAISYHHSFNELEKALQNVLPEDVWYQIKEFENTEVGKTIMFTSGQTCIWFKETTYSTISHEIFHAIDFLMRRIGCKLTPSSDDAYAYLIGYITTEIYKNLKNETPRIR